jgi:protein-disulfide isomerase
MVFGLYFATFRSRKCIPMPNTRRRRQRQLGQKGEFWEMHDTLYTHQAALDDRHLVQYATSLGIPAPVFQEAIQAHTYMDRIRQDFLSGVRSGVNGTPTFFINGVRQDGSYDLETLLTATADAAG